MVEDFDLTDDPFQESLLKLSTYNFEGGESLRFSSAVRSRFVLLRFANREQIRNASACVGSAICLPTLIHWCAWECCCCGLWHLSEAGSNSGVILIGSCSAFFVLASVYISISVCGLVTCFLRDSFVVGFSFHLSEVSRSTFVSHHGKTKCLRVHGE